MQIIESDIYFLALGGLLTFLALFLAQLAELYFLGWLKTRKRTKVLMQKVLFELVGNTSFLDRYPNQHRLLSISAIEGSVLSNEFYNLEVNIRNQILTLKQDLVNLTRTEIDGNTADEIIKVRELMNNLKFNLLNRLE